MSSGPPFDEPTRAAHYLALLAQPGIGPATLRALTQHAGSLEELVSRPWAPALLAKPEGAQLPRLAPAALSVLAQLPERLAAALPRARRAVAEASGAGLAVLTVDHPGYPPALLHGVSGPPPVLFVEGTLPAALASEFDSLPSCAVVGTRRASRYSLTFAADLAAALARLGATVVSGLALGVDAAAHAGALEGAREAEGRGGPTVAVLGGGHGRFHPPANRRLAAAIVGAGGAVISEWPPDVTPAPYQFIQRNRVISGLSRAVVVVEASRHSGAVNTAGHALTQGREVYAVPGRPGPAMAGNHALLHDGAALLEGIGDLAEAFSSVPDLGSALAAHVVEPVARRRRPSRFGRSGGRGDTPDGPDGSRRVKGPSQGSPPATAPLLAPGAAPELRGPTLHGELATRVAEALAGLGEATLDDLLAALDAAPGPGATSPRTNGAPAPTGARARPSTADVTAALLELEVDGLIVRFHNGRYASRASVTRQLERRPKRR